MTAIVSIAGASKAASNYYVNPELIDGGIIWSEDKAATFDEYKPQLNHQTHPKWLFAEDFNYTLWCNAHGLGVVQWMNASESHWWAREEGDAARTGRLEAGPVAYDPSNAFHWYRTNENYGLVTEFRKVYEEWKERMTNPGPWCHPPVIWYDEYETPGVDQQEAIDINFATMPGLGGPDRYSIEWNKVETFKAEEMQDAFFILTQQKVYDRATEDPNTLTLSQDEIDKAYYTPDEKQAALWELKYFNLKINEKGRENDQEDRNLGLAGKRFQKFYDAIHEGANAGEDNYKDFVKAMWYNEEEDTINDLDGKHVEEIPNIIIDGESYKTYQYNDTKVQVNPADESYIMGPYVIDYSVLDDYPDPEIACLDATDVKGTGKSTNYSGDEGGPTPDPNQPPAWIFPGGVLPPSLQPSTNPAPTTTDITQMKFDAVEKVTVYTEHNGDMTNIEDLGGSFKIAYKMSDGFIAEEAKERRIIDYDGNHYYEFADGEKVPSFLSRKPFYIVVYRGSMKPEDFKQMYAKIDLQYLESCEGEMSRYEGNVVKYWYTAKNKPWQFPYRACGYMPIPTGPNQPHAHEEKILTEYLVPPKGTWEFELHFTKNVAEAQEHISWNHSVFNRVYKTYSFVITSFEQDRTPPDMEIQKFCNECGPLYGANFNIKLNITGHDVTFNRDINEEIKLSRISDVNGSVKILASEIADYGVYLENLTGCVIQMEVEETAAPAGHKLITDKRNYQIVMEMGKIISSPGGAPSGKNLFVERWENEDADTPEIILEKVNRNADTGALESVKAHFDIHVSWTKSGGTLNKENGRLENLGELIDNKDNVIRGTTKDGQLKLTQEDFDNLPDKLDLKGYTGMLTLDIVEVSAEGGWKVNPSSRDITLIYYEGKLLDYTRYNNAEVLAHQVKDNPMAEIYNYLKGTGDVKSDSTAIEYVKEWATGQIQKNEGMTYEDVYGWLVKYIEDKYRDENGNVTIPSQLDEWKPSTMSVEEFDGKVRIVIEDEPGNDFELPDMPPKEEEELLMRFAGYVFLDQRETKGSAKSSNGKFDQGEAPIRGVEVTLYEDNGKIAELVPSDNPEEIRTNPTITDQNGYYEFRGVDPMKHYYIGFKYNGMEFKATEKAGEAQYNSDEWAVTSKGGKGEGAGIGNYNVVNADTKAWDYYTIQGMYEEMTNEVIKYINANKKYPADKFALIQAPSNPRDAKDFADKIAYMREVEVESFAGYSSQGNKGQTYPHSSLGNTFIINESSMNSGMDEILFAGDQVKVIYPGQLQIHLGLVEKENIDLSLVSDIVDTVVSINQYDTKYDYFTGEANYHQYMFAEDYDYSETENEDGVAYYTEDKVHFYITYDIMVNNESSLAGTKINKIVNYYNKELRFDPNGYTTTNGTKIDAIKSYSGKTPSDGNDLGVSAGDGSAKGATADYKTLIVNIGQEIGQGEDNAKHVRLTFELVGNEDNAKEILKQKLKQDTNSEYARSWTLGNYSEIFEYETTDGYLDRDSKPGNFMIKDYEDASIEFQKAFVEYIKTGSEDASRKMNMWYNRMNTEIREDDAWYTGIILTNSGYIRKLSGHMWEAADGSGIKNSLDIYGIDPPKYEGNNNLKGLKVELVEMVKDANKLSEIEGKGGKVDKEPDGATQIVRAVTKTDENGRYEFKSYIAGDYAVRFVYGGDDSTVYSEITKNTFKPEGEADPLPINGQYYQSTKANPNTAGEKYWYKVKEYDEKGAEEKEVSNKDLLTKYSDAYDDSYSRLSQMNSKITENVDNQGGMTTETNKPMDLKNGKTASQAQVYKDYETSSDYNYEGVISVESTWHNDPIYAYTSTMELEIEYIRPQTKGDTENNWYEYKIEDVDFGVTPRAYNDVSITKYIENIKLRNQDGTLIRDQDFNRDGVKVDKEGKPMTVAGDYIHDSSTANGLTDVIFRDGNIWIEYDQELLQNLSLEVKYHVVVENNSDKRDNHSDTIKYIFEDGKVIAVVYYEEETAKLVAYEKDELRDNQATIVYHNERGSEYSETCLNKENRKARSGRLAHYAVATGFDDSMNPAIITSRVTDIVDYVNEPLGFTKDQRNAEMYTFNKDWSEVNDRNGGDGFVSSRENYNVNEDGEISFGQREESGKKNIVDHSLTQRVRYTGTELYKDLKPGEDAHASIVLTTLLNTGVSDAFDNEFPNHIEIVRLSNIAGKIVDIEGYDISGHGTGTDYVGPKETSEVRHLRDLEYPQHEYSGIYTPTISMSRAQTITITEPTGLSVIADKVTSNLGIVLVVLVVFAVGVVLIKKFVLVPKQK